MKTVKVFKVTYPTGDCDPLIVDNFTCLDELLQINYSEIGDKFLIEVIEMDKEKFFNLPEWGGF